MAFVQAMNSSTQKKGVNGADVYTEAGVGDARVTLFTMLNRGLEEHYIRKSVQNIAFRNQSDEIRDLFVMAFQTRDVRGGKGEKKLFYEFMKILHHFWPLMTAKLVKLIPEYGCWRDMWELWREIPSLKADILKIVKEQFTYDLVHVGFPDDKKDVSLLAKWLPREKSSTYPQFVLPIANALYPNESSARHMLIRYRKETSYINAALKTVEINMCGGTWRKIQPEAVPGRCMTLHNKAFLNLKRESNTEERYPDSKDRKKCRKHFLEFTEDIVSGKAKAHGAHVVMPHEIVMKAKDYNLSYEEHIILQAQWDSIREETLRLGGLGKTVVMCDFSGSMSDMRGLPLHISTALGILISECTHSSFKDHILTFDAEPTWHSFTGLTTLKSKLNSIRNCGHGLNTDFYKACQMILNRLIVHRVPSDEVPDDLIVITDMGFDEARTTVSSCVNGNYGRPTYKVGNWNTILNTIRQEFHEAGVKVWGAGHGWKVPRIVIWNVSASYKDFHATAEQEGVIQLSGWSPNILKVLQKGGLEVATPYKGMRIALDDARYDKVREVYNSEA